MKYYTLLLLEKFLAIITNTLQCRFNGKKSLEKFKFSDQSQTKNLYFTVLTY